MLDILKGLQMAILVAAVVHYLLGWFLWSEAGLGSVLLTKSQLNQKTDPMHMAWYLIASLLSAGALAVAIKVFHASAGSLNGGEGIMQLFNWVLGSQEENMIMCAMRVATFVWLGFQVPSIISGCICNNDSMQKCGAHLIAKLIPLLGAAAAISYLM